MYEINGEEFTLETLQGKAKEYNMDFNEYIKAMKKKGLVEKTNGSQTEDATASQVDMASKSEDTSSEQAKVNEENLLRQAKFEFALPSQKAGMIVGVCLTWLKA